MKNHSSPLLEIAKLYHKKTPRSLPVCLLKTSLVPLEIFERYLPSNAKILDIGCGEGMLSNKIARNFPHSTVHGVDLDAEKLAEAKTCCQPNSTFEHGDGLQFTQKGQDAVIFNDVLHHNTHQNQEALIAHAHELLKEDGFLFLKDVDFFDKLDNKITTFWDTRIYPGGPLNYRGIDEWRSVLENNFFEILSVEIAKHPYIASRTIIVARKIPKFSLEPKPRKTGHLQVFVTGASGFIGRHLATDLLENGLDGKPVQLTLLARKPVRLSPNLLKNATVIQGDLKSCETLSRELIDSMDYVFHFAGEKKLFGEKSVLYRGNVEGTESIAKAFIGAKNLKRLVFAGTIGAVDRLPNDPCSRPLLETDTPNPGTEYGKTKLRAEEIITRSALPFSVVRIPWAFGTHMTPDTHMRNLFERIMNGSLITQIYFPGKVSLIAVEDLVSATKLLAIHPKALRENFFVAGFPPIALGDIFTRFAQIIPGKSTRLLRIPRLIQFVARKLRRFLPITFQNLNSDVLCVNDDKIRALGYRPQQDLDSSLNKLATWTIQDRRPSTIRSQKSDWVRAKYTYSLLE